MLGRLHSLEGIGMLVPSDIYYYECIPGSATSSFDDIHCSVPNAVSMQINKFLPKIRHRYVCSNTDVVPNRQLQALSIELV